MPAPPKCRPPDTSNALSRLRRVALLGGGHSGNDAHLIRGIQLYVRPAKPWLLYDGSRQGPDLIQVRRVSSLGLDGVIAHVTTQQFAAALARLKVPVVNVASVMADAGYPRVGFDDRAVGAMAAEYFLARGFTRFGYAGNPSWAFSDDRLAGFAGRLGEAGCEVSVCPDDPVPNVLDVMDPDFRLSQVLSEYRQWVRMLGWPAAVYASTDGKAGMIAEILREVGVRVPEQVALLGTDNYELVCQMAYPPLSSVQLPAEKAGFEAARLLDHLMEGGPPPPSPTLLGPVGVVTRQSSDVVAVADVDLTTALRYIREHAHEGINVRDVLRNVPLGRVSLEQRFRAHLGRTPLQEIHRVRVEHAKQLLAGTDLAMPNVAAACGFRDSTHLAILFRRYAGMTPTSYRRQFAVR